MAAGDACDRTYPLPTGAGAEAGAGAAACYKNPPTRSTHRGARRILKDAVRCRRGRKTCDTWTTLVAIHNVHLKHALNVRLYLAHKRLLSCASRQSTAIRWIMTVLHTPHMHSQTQ